MQTVSVAIVGGGLSGLYAASLLEQQGIHNFVVLEARPALGGRIVSASFGDIKTVRGNAAWNGTNRFDLGPTWFWPALQPELGDLIRHLGPKRFAQYETGDMIVERSRNEPPKRVRGYTMSPESMRLIGGMGAVIDALGSTIPSDRIEVQQRVTRIRSAEGHVELDAVDSQDRRTAYRASYELLAVPPRLASETIEFVPALPDSLSRTWRGTATWMASHAKYVAVYERPFWREQGLSGEGRSAAGPLTEIHDASMPGGNAALFGFFGVPASVRAKVSDEQLRMHCRAQLERMFGESAAHPVTERLKDWAADRYTAAAADLRGVTEHGIAPPNSARSGVWRNRLFGIASEWSPRFGGYVAGAVDAARSGVRAIGASGTSDLAVNAVPIGSAFS